MEGSALVVEGFPMVQLSEQPIANSSRSAIPTDRWVDATWEEFLFASERPEFAKAKVYFFNQQMRIETMGVGAGHARDNTLLLFMINLFCTIADISLDGLTNASYRSVRHREAQPDISYYIGDRSSLTPKGSSIIDLDHSPKPDLAIEISDSSLAEDLGKKRLLYETIGIAEYWVIDVDRSTITAFAIEALGSRQIQNSLVLPGLSFQILEEALKLSRSQNQSQIGRWLMQQFRVIGE
jgi:Uma2 family endonuclease